MLNEETEHAMVGQRVGFATLKMVIMKGSHYRAKRIAQSVDDFTESEWDKVLNIILKESQTNGAEVDLKIELLAETKQLRFLPKPAPKRQHV